VSAPTPQSPTAPQTQPSAQQNQTSFIRALLAKANAKLGSNRQKKLDKLMQLAQKKGSITNEQAQDLLHCSDATATRYLSKLVQQGRLNRTDGSHWVKYIFVR
jgi:Fic family protein